MKYSTLIEKTHDLLLNKVETLHTNTMSAYDITPFFERFTSDENVCIEAARRTKDTVRTFYFMHNPNEIATFIECGGITLVLTEVLNDFFDYPITDAEIHNAVFMLLTYLTRQ